MTSSVAIFFISFKKFDLWAMRSQLIEPVADDEKSCLLHMHQSRNITGTPINLCSYFSPFSPRE